MFPEFVGQRLRCKFYVAVNILCKLAQCYYIEKLQLLTVLNEVIFCYNSAKYEANFVIFFLSLLEMIWALNLLKRFQPHFNSYLVKLVTFDIIRILLIF